MKRTAEQQRVLKQASRGGRAKYRTPQARRRAVASAKPVKARTAAASKGRRR